MVAAFSAITETTPPGSTQRHSSAIRGSADSTYISTPWQSTTENRRPSVASAAASPAAWTNRTRDRTSSGSAASRSRAFASIASDGSRMVTS